VFPSGGKRVNLCGCKVLSAACALHVLMDAKGGLQPAQASFPVETKSRPAVLEPGHTRGN